MTYKRFEDTPAFQAALALAHAVYDFTRDRAFTPLGDLRDQLRRASLSISLNIAEGFELGTTLQLIKHLYIARGSAGETRAALVFAADRPELSHLQSQAHALTAKAEAVSRQLAAWANHLQNSDIDGMQRLTHDTRAEYDGDKRRAAFLDKLKGMTKRPFPSAPDASNEDPT